MVFWYKVGTCPVAQKVKNLPAMQETQVQSLGWEDPLKKGMTSHSRILAWRIPWTREPGGLHSMSSQRVEHDWVLNTTECLTHTHTHISDTTSDAEKSQLWYHVSLNENIYVCSSTFELCWRYYDVGPVSPHSHPFWCYHWSEN